jgi:hypothetical protein
VLELAGVAFSLIPDLPIELPTRKLTALSEPQNSPELRLYANSPPDGVTGLKPRLRLSYQAEI